MVVLRIVTMARANVNLVLNGMLENAQVTNTDLKKIASKIHQLFAHISLTFSGIQQNSTESFVFFISEKEVLQKNVMKLRKLKFCLEILCSVRNMGSKTV